jgi:hypothetical protein
MLVIQTTGLQDYAPGGKARVKLLNIGGPGAGKTRFSSYFPQPIYADCEGGLASVADRNVPYVRVSNSQDMLDLLAYLKQECRQPAEQRTYNTIVVDTLDAFQRKVKNEWMEREKKATFTGWDAWGYLNSRMQLLMTRLLNLDMNVIVNVHFKDRTVTDDDTGKTTHTFELQLSGEWSDTAFNDFDLVGWMGTFWKAEGGERVLKRGLTFKPTPERPFLKDRLHVTPDWLEVNFDESDYTKLFDAIQSRVQDIEEGAVVGEVPDLSPDVAAPNAAVKGPTDIGTGALPPTPPRDIPLAQLDKPTLVKRCRDAGITTTVDGTPIKGNTLKSELIAALEARAQKPAPAPETTEAGQPTTDPSPEPPPTQPVEPTEPAALPTEPDAPAQPKLANAKRVQVDGIGQVDTKTGEVSLEEAVQTVKDELDGQVIEEQVTPTPAPAPVAQPAPAPQVDAGTCEDCGKSLAGEPTDFVKLSWIKYRRRLCKDDYTRRKTAS